MAARSFRFAATLSQEPDVLTAAHELVEAIETKLGRRTIDLAVLFFSSHYVDQADALASVIRTNLHPRVLIGCSGEGIIGSTEELEGQPAVTLWTAALPGVSLTPLRPTFIHHHARDPEQEDDVQSAVTGLPDLKEEAKPPVFLLFGDPFSAPINDLLLALEERYPQAKAIGGLAGGGNDLGENRLVLDDEVFDDGVVGVALSGAVNVRTVISQGCRPIGEPYVVTKADRNVVHELGGKPALERLQAAFESLPDAERELAARALHVGVVIDEHRAHFARGDFLVRNLIGADRGVGSLAIGDTIHEGQTVQFHVRDADSASEDLALLLAADLTANRHRPLGALLFSCCGRGQGLFGKPNHDIDAIVDRVGRIPVAGFFAQGEIGPVGGSNFLHGYTASLALFSEPEPEDQGRRDDQ